MRRHKYLFLIALGVILFALRALFLPIVPQGIPPEQVRLVEHVPLSPLANPSLAQIQNTIDRISEAALQENWHAAATHAQELEVRWRQISLVTMQKFDIEQNINEEIVSLQRAVTDKNKVEVLIAAGHLTDLISKLPNSK